MSKRDGAEHENLIRTQGGGYQWPCGLQHGNPDYPSVGGSATSLENTWTLTDCKFRHSFQELIETHRRHLLEANIPWLPLLMTEKKRFLQKTVQFTLWTQPFPPMLARGVPGEEISTLSMQKYSSFPAFSNPPPSQESRSQPASALAQTYLSLPLRLRAVGLWAVFDRDTSIFLLHLWCVLYIILLFSVPLPAWQVGSRPFTKNTIALNASQDNLHCSDKHFVGIWKGNNSAKKSKPNR